MEFFGSFFTDFIANALMVDKTDIDYFLQAEVIIRVDFNTCLLRDCCPVAILHTISSKGNSYRHYILECVDLALHDVGDIENFWHVTITEVPEGLIDRLLAVFESVFKSLGVKFVPLAAEPAVM